MPCKRLLILFPVALQLEKKLLLVGRLASCVQIKSSCAVLSSGVNNLVRCSAKTCAFLSLDHAWLPSVCLIGEACNIGLFNFLVAFHNLVTYSLCSFQKIHYKIPVWPYGVCGFFAAKFSVPLSYRLPSIL